MLKKVVGVEYKTFTMGWGEDTVKFYVTEDNCRYQDMIVDDVVKKNKETYIKLTE